MSHPGGGIKLQQEPDAFTPVGFTLTANRSKYHATPREVNHRNGLATALEFRSEASPQPQALAVCEVERGSRPTGVVMLPL